MSAMFPLHAVQQVAAPTVFLFMASYFFTSSSFTFFYQIRPQFCPSISNWQRTKKRTLAVSLQKSTQTPSQSGLVGDMAWLLARTTCEMRPNKHKHIYRDTGSYVGQVG